MATSSCVTVLSDSAIHICSRMGTREISTLATPQPGSDSHSAGGLERSRPGGRRNGCLGAQNRDASDLAIVSSKRCSSRRA